MNTAVGFKEWQVICDALASGKQSLIFRKGGIHEGRAGFSFKHEEFFLFPTRFHAQAEFVTEGQGPKETEWQLGDIVPITHFAKVQSAVTLTDWDQVIALQNQHIWTEETLKERFYWEGKGMATGSIHCAFVQVYKMPKPYELRYEKGHGGCRSWVDLPAETLAFAENAQLVTNSADRI